MQKRRARFVPFLAFGALLLMGPPVQAHDDRERGGGRTLEGLWSVEDHLLSACPDGTLVRTIQDMNMFMRGGQMIETPGTPSVAAPPLQRGTPGLGTWRHVDGQHYTAAFRFFRFNGDDDTFAGTQTAVKHIELNAGGTTFTSKGTTDIFDASGALLATRCSIGTATRVE